MVPKYHRTDSFFRSLHMGEIRLPSQSSANLSTTNAQTILSCDVRQYEIFDITQDIYIFSFSQNI